MSGKKTEPKLKKVEILSADGKKLSKEEAKKMKKIESLEEGKTKKDKLEEQLSVYKEVRAELADAYKKHKEVVSSIEELRVENETLIKGYDNKVKTLESLQKELDAYKAREVEAEKMAYNKRLEKLSKNFDELGQGKTVEELSALSKEVIGEFESITSVALRTKNEEKLDALTVPTQAMPGRKPTEAPRSQGEVGLSFVKICEALQKQQNTDGSSAKRTINL